MSVNELTCDGEQRTLSMAELAGRHVPAEKNLDANLFFFVVPEHLLNKLPARVLLLASLVSLLVGWTHSLQRPICSNNVQNATLNECRISSTFLHYSFLTTLTFNTFSIFTHYQSSQ